MHLSLELFKGVTGINVIHVPYKGGGPSMAAIVSGEVAMSFNTPAAITQHIKSGRVRGIAITGAKRFSALQDIPTLAESGINGVEADPFWRGGTHRNVTRRRQSPTRTVEQTHQRERYARAAGGDGLRAGSQQAG